VDAANVVVPEVFMVKSFLNCDVKVIVPVPPIIILVVPDVTEPVFVSPPLQVSVLPFIINVVPFSVTNPLIVQSSANVNVAFPLNNTGQVIVAPPFVTVIVELYTILNCPVPASVVVAPNVTAPLFTLIKKFNVIVPLYAVVVNVKQFAPTAWSCVQLGLLASNITSSPALGTAPSSQFAAKFQFAFVVPLNVLVAIRASFHI